MILIGGDSSKVTIVELPLNSFFYSISFYGAPSYVDVTGTVLGKEIQQKTT